MIQTYSRLTVADNTGAKEVMCINLPGAHGRKSASLGDIIVVSVKDAIPMSPIKKGARLLWPPKFLLLSLLDLKRNSFS